jgi:beta-carotene 3-hydroxylase
MDLWAILVPILLILGTVAIMEFLAWWAHKYIMHGWGWGWHKTHHEPHEGGLEVNDLYSVIFALCSIPLFIIGVFFWRPILWIAIGIVVYGILYFIAHDGLVHQRWPFKYVPRKGYLKRLYQAHRLHHAVIGKDGAVSFGFIYAPPVESLKRELQANRRALSPEGQEDVSRAG